MTARRSVFRFEKHGHRSPYLPNLVSAYTLFQAVTRWCGKKASSVKRKRTFIFSVNRSLLSGDPADNVELLGSNETAVTLRRGSFRHIHNGLESIYKLQFVYERRWSSVSCRQTSPSSYRSIVCRAGTPLILRWS